MSPSSIRCGGTPSSRRTCRVIALVGALVALSLACAFADPVEDQFNFATGLFIEGDYELAVNEYRAFLNQHPDHALAGKAQFQLGESLLRLERTEEAIAPLEAYVARKDAEPDRLAAALFRLGKAYEDLEKHEKAVEFYRSFAEKFPDHKQAPAARYWVGECLLRTGRFADARDALQKALERDKGDRYEPYCVYRLGCALSALEQHEPAAERFADALKRFPNEEFAGDAALRLARSYEAMGRYDDALTAYKDIEDRYGEKLLVEATMGRASVLYQKKELEKAAALFATVVEKYPQHPMAGTARYNAGSALYNLGKYKEALPHFEALAAGQGEQAVASLYWKGMCLLELKKAAEALEPLQAAARAEGPYRTRASFAIGDAYFEAGDFQKAQEAYAAVAKDFPKDELAGQALYSAATAASRRGAHDEAAALAGQLLATKEYAALPVAAKARLVLGESLFRQEKFAEACEVFAGLLKDQPEEVGKDLLLYKLAWCSYRQQKAQEAADQFRRVADEHPASEFAAESLYMAGKLLAEQGQHEQAKALYLRCVQEYAASPMAEQAAYAAAVSEFSRRNWAQAATDFTAFLKGYPNSTLAADARFYLGEALFAAGDFDAARQAYEAVTAQHPQSELAPKALYGTAWCLREKKALAESADAFAKVAASFPQSDLAASSLYWAGRCLMDLGKWDDARALFAKALAATGADKVAADASYYSCNCLLRAEAYADAVAAYQAFLEKFAGSERNASALYDLAWAYRGLKDEAKAQEYFRRVAEVATQVELKADALFRLAEARYDEGKYDESAQLYGEIVALKDVAFLDKVYYKLAWSHDKAGRVREALEAYRAVADKYPQSEVAPDAAFRVGRVLQELGEHQQAADQFAGLLQKQGLDKETAARTRFYLAESLRALKKWADALRLYRELGQPDSGFDPAYLAFYGAGSCALELDALQDAWDAFTQVVQKTETETAAMAQLGLGEVLYRQKKFVDASREFLKVDILYGYPKWKPRALLRAAQSFKDAGQADRAARYLTRLIETYPDSQEAAEAQNMRKELK